MSWKLYNADGEYMGEMIHAEDAAAMVAILGDGSTVRYLDRVVWHEGTEKQSAYESYDDAASTMHHRVNRRYAAAGIQWKN